MMFLGLIMLSSMMTGFMYKPASSMKATVVVAFNNYEVYTVPATIDDNTTMLQAISGYYYTRLDNGSLYCIRDSCNNNESKWLAFDEYGVSVKPENYILKNNEKTYLIYNASSDYSQEDEEAIKGLLGL